MARGRSAPPRWGEPSVPIGPPTTNGSSPPAVNGSTPSEPTTPAAPRRRLRRPRRLTPGHAATALCAVAAGVAALVALQNRAATTTVDVAATQIPAGAAITPTEVRAAKLPRSDRSLLAGIVTPSQLHGLVTTTPIAPGNPITRSETRTGRPAGAGLGQMSLPVPADQADGGNIGVGDHVDVIDTTGSGATYVAQNLPVLAVTPKASSSVLGATSGTGSNYWVTVAVNRPTALRLAAALGGSSSTSSSNIEVVRSTGERGYDPVSSYPNPTNPKGHRR